MTLRSLRGIPLPQLSNLLKRECVCVCIYIYIWDYIGEYIGAIRGDTGSLDYA